jgi:hypothetical protein
MRKKSERAEGGEQMTEDRIFVVLRSRGNKEMRNRFRPHIVPRFLILGFLLLAILCGALYSCSAVQYNQPREVSYEQLSTSYDRIRLKITGSLDVLEMFDKPGYELEPGSAELLSQSDTAAASLGQGKNGYKTWFTMVAFNKQNMTAERKYFYLVDEKAGSLLDQIAGFLISPTRGLVFDCQVVLPTEVLQRPYMTQEAKQIAILQQVAESLRKDADELGRASSNEPGQGNQKLVVSAMLMNQVFKTVLLELEKSPSLAKNLKDTGGVQFDHINFNKGKICMTEEGGIITVKVKLGYFIDKFEPVENPT